MDLKKMGSFLKELRNERGLTQEQLAERFYVSNRSVSRWETGSNMPDVATLVELADFFDVDIRELIDGERRSTAMDADLKDTLTSVAVYSDEDKKRQHRKMMSTIGLLLMGFGLFIIIASFSAVPRDSGWGAKGAIFGILVASAGVYQWANAYSIARKVMLSIAAFLLLLVSLIAVDYLGVVTYQQIPRFSYLRVYDSSEGDGTITHHAPFYTVIEHRSGTGDDRIEIIYP